MRLHLADSPHRVLFFFREKPHPWKSPQHDFATEQLFLDCGDHRRDQELADAKQAILDT